MKKIFILDTNVLLHSAAALESFEENIVIIPMPVIEELDKFKKNQDELGRNARRVVRRIDTLREKSAKANGPKLFEGVPMENASGGKEAGTLIVALDVPLENSNLSATDPAYADNRILAIAENILHFCIGFIHTAGTACCSEKRQQSHTQPGKHHTITGG